MSILSSLRRSQQAQAPMRQMAQAPMQQPQFGSQISAYGQAPQPQYNVGNLQQMQGGVYGTPSGGYQGQPQQGGMQGQMAAYQQAMQQAQAPQSFNQMNAPQVGGFYGQNAIRNQNRTAMGSLGGFGGFNQQQAPQRMPPMRSNQFGGYAQQMPQQQQFSQFSQPQYGQQMMQGLRSRRL